MPLAEFAVHRAFEVIAELVLEYKHRARRTAVAVQSLDGPATVVPSTAAGVGALAPGAPLRHDAVNWASTLITGDRLLEHTADLPAV